MKEKPVQDIYAVSPFHFSPCEIQFLYLQEAALYIREGEDDAKFYHHPDGVWAKRVYRILHYKLYYVLHFSVSILVLLLAFAETPSVAESLLDDNQKKTLVSVSKIQIQL